MIVLTFSGACAGQGFPSSPARHAPAGPCIDEAGTLRRRHPSSGRLHCSSIWSIDTCAPSFAPHRREDQAGGRRRARRDGLTVSDAFRLMMVRIAAKRLPFEPLAPNAETVAAMEAARRGDLVTVRPSTADGRPPCGRLGGPRPLNGSTGTSGGRFVDAGLVRSHPDLPDAEHLDLVRGSHSELPLTAHIARGAAISATP